MEGFNFLDQFDEDHLDLIFPNQIDLVMTTAKLGGPRVGAEAEGDRMVRSEPYGKI